MNRWLLLSLILALLMAGQSLRADEANPCPHGRAVFGKLSCTEGPASEALLEAYFYGATSLTEIQSTFPGRLAKVESRCRKSAAKRQPASVTGADVPETVQFKVTAVEACLGKRGYQQPCTRDDDCIEHFCHRERGTCSAVFTVPLSNY